LDESKWATTKIWSVEIEANKANLCKFNNWIRQDKAQISVIDKTVAKDSCIRAGVANKDHLSFKIMFDQGPGNRGNKTQTQIR